MPRSTPARHTKQPASLTRLAALTGGNHRGATGAHAVYIVLDYSLSMNEGRKMRQAKDGARSFAERATKSGYAVGLIQFASSAHHALSPSTSLTTLETLLDAWEPNGSTNMADAIALATDKLRVFSGTRVQCLVTDGEPDDKALTRTAASVARNRGIDIMAIGTDDADHQFLATLTTRSDLAVTVPKEEFRTAISGMALLLPAPR